MEVTWLESDLPALGAAATGADWGGETAAGLLTTGADWDGGTPAGLLTTGAGIFTTGEEGVAGAAEAGTVKGTLQAGHAKVLPIELSGSCIFILHFGQPKTIGIAKDLI